MGDRDPEVQPPPEALVIRRHRMALGWSVPKAAAATDGQISPARWAQIEQGFVAKGGGRVPTSASDGALAHMAHAVHAHPDELAEVGKGEAASVLWILRGGQESDDQGPRDPIEMMTRYFRDDSIPAEQRRAKAKRLFSVMPYYLLGEEPPEHLLKGEDQVSDGPDNEDGSKRSA